MAEPGECVWIGYRDDAEPVVKTTKQPEKWDPRHWAPYVRIDIYRAAIEALRSCEYSGWNHDVDEPDGQRCASCEGAENDHAKGCYLMLVLAKAKEMGV